MKLIPNWRQGWKFWSVRLQVVGAALLALSEAPNYAIQAIALLPLDIRAEISPEIIRYIALGSVAAGTIARFIKQRKLEAGSVAGVGQAPEREPGISPEGLGGSGLPGDKP